MTRKPPSLDRDDDVLTWLTQDHRSQIDWTTLDEDQFQAEAAAAMYMVSQVEHIEPLPEHLVARLADSLPSVRDPRAARKPVRESWLSNIRLAWGSAGFASAIAVVLAVRLVTLPEAAVPGRVALAQASHYSLQPGPDAAGQAVRGEVVWDKSRGGGYIKLAGLPANNPSQEQYQLWVFDGSRDQRYPVDGGVFNVRPNGEVEMWIRVPVPVREAALFAVTVEHAGGTVVSDRGRIVAVAKVGA